MTKPNQEEFEKLFRLHHKPLRNLAFNLVRDRDVANDVVQEVFVKLWQNREKVEFGDQIKHYLFKATSHTALNYLRTSKRIVSAENEHLMNLQSPGGDEILHYEEFAVKVREAIDRLPPRCKMIYLLSRHEGLKYQEIADTLDISLKTVENQMGIALEKLREDLKPWLPPPAVVIMILAALLGFFL